ncbi:hypothetical protein G5B39_09010 [Rhodobacteraceae bacterium SC52]|nr:hypothetical protein G5B39_09010 [Rhodobacteraceae bacterium SC52]
MNIDRPIRVVSGAFVSYLPGGQGEVIREDWLAQIGFGGEIDFENTWVPWITTTRLMFR